MRDRVLVRACARYGIGLGIYYSVNANEYLNVAGNNVRYSHLGQALKADIAMRQMPALKMVEYKILKNVVKAAPIDEEAIRSAEKDPKVYSAHCDEMVVLLSACRTPALNGFGIDVGSSIQRLDTLRVDGGGGKTL